MKSTHKYDFISGEVLLVNKPLNWTSFDVVNRLRYSIKNRLKIKKIKVGHAGTLDPLADGLLIVCTGKQTKNIESYMGLDKTYTGIISLGATTPSYDLETEIDAEFSTDHITHEMILETARRMTGKMDQYPPIFSAKKVDGKKAYDLARKGKEFELKPKRIEISKFEITEIRGDEIRFLVACSTGTYIRSLANDFGKNLNSGAHLKALKREKIGAFSLDKALEVDQLMEQINTFDVYIPERN